MTSGSALAQSATDAQCLILSNAYATQAKDQNAKKMAESAFYFYLGRIGNSATAAQVKALLDQQMKALTQETAGKLMNACADTVASRMQLVQSFAGPPPAAAQPKKGQPEGR
jgi:hypothetical protein